ncbi:hypothetical protein BCL57_001144 [Agromyces flavus]|uniref:DNA-binding transcriptional regulator, MarR family n=1 Tax=Agromyces flavus TaxID=589382 RepID=A0A1H1ZAD9_9MICO|nr:hypothetical protein [Agromyces flavus]MCP2366990.1 hypothetical protein [Agromyces flavus]SDT30462.1 hypothetical protein SAMN04489721_3069 [Agromyces flavus]
MNHHDHPDTAQPDDQPQRDASVSDERPDGPAPDSTTDGAGRPLGFWLTALDRLIDREFETAFADLEVTRRDWRVLNLLGGEVRDDRLRAKLEARPDRMLPLVERGWVAGEPGAWELTEAGRAAHADLAERVDGIRSRIRGAVSSDDYATTLASLEAMARALGWDESSPGIPRGRGRFGRRGPGRPWGARRARGFGGFGRFGTPPWAFDERDDHRGHGAAHEPHHHGHGHHRHPHGEREVHVHVHLDDHRGRRRDHHRGHGGPHDHGER